MTATTGRCVRGALRVGVAIAVVALAACSDDDGSAQDLCAAVADRGTTTVLEGFDPTDPEAALEQLRDARLALGDLLDAAPEEVRDDLEVEVDYVEDLIDALDDVEPGDAAESALRIQAVTNANPDVNEAAANLAAFAAAEC